MIPTLCWSPDPGEESRRRAESAMPWLAECRPAPCRRQCPPRFPHFRPRLLPVGAGGQPASAPAVVLDGWARPLSGLPISKSRGSRRQKFRGPRPCWIALRAPWPANRPRPSPELFERPTTGTTSGLRRGDREAAPAPSVLRQCPCMPAVDAEIAKHASGWPNCPACIPRIAAPHQGDAARAPRRGFFTWSGPPIIRFGIHQQSSCSPLHEVPTVFMSAPPVRARSRPPLVARHRHGERRHDLVRRRIRVPKFSATRCGPRAFPGFRWRACGRSGHRRAGCRAEPSYLRPFHDKRGRSGLRSVAACATENYGSAETRAGRYLSLGRPRPDELHLMRPVGP